MAEDKKGVIVYASWIKKFEALSDEEAGVLIKHFFRYVNDLNPIAPDRTTKLMFIDIEDTLKRDLIKWEKRAERSRENGNKGGRPPIDNNLEKPKETQQVISKPKKPVIVKDNVNGNVSVIDNNLSSTKVEFDLFWNTYDKKVGDKDKIKSKWNSLKIEDQKLILVHVHKYKIAQNDKKYRKDPSTYLNNKSWLDEIIYSKKSSVGGEFVP